MPDLSTAPGGSASEEPRRPDPAGTTGAARRTCPYAAAQAAARRAGDMCSASEVLDQDSWIDRKRAAELAGRHVDSIRRDEKAHHLTTRVGLGGTVLLRVGDLVAIGRIDPARLDPTVTAAEVAQAGALRREVLALRAENARLHGYCDAHQEVVDALKAQIAVQQAALRALTAAMAATGL